MKQINKPFTWEVSEKTKNDNVNNHSKSSDDKSLRQLITTALRYLRIIPQSITQYLIDEAVGRVG